MLITMVTWVALNLYWFIPDLFSYSTEFEKVANAYSSVGASFQSTVRLNSAPIIGAIRLLGLWVLNSGHKGDPYVLWAPAYESAPLIVISFLIPILAFLPVLLKPRDKHVLFVASFAIISLLLVNGSYSPLGSWMYTHIPLFGAFFNQPYGRFGMYLALAYAFLIGYALTELLNSSRQHFQRTKNFAHTMIAGTPIFLVLSLIVGVYAFPLWTGDVIRANTAIIQSNRYKMPAYYQDASDWLGSDMSDFNIIILPISQIGYAELKWDDGGYGGPHPAEWLFPKPIIPSALAGNGMAGKAINLIINNSTASAAKILALMNVKYVLFHEDTNWAYIADSQSWISISPERLRLILSSSDAFYLEKTFGKLDFYKNNYWQPREFYPAFTSILVDENIDQLIQIAGKDSFKLDESVILFSDQLEAIPINATVIQYQALDSTGIVSNFLKKERLIRSAETDSAQITYEKVDPTKYIVIVNTPRPFYLVFSKSYDEGWIASIDEQQIPLQYHFTANGYANGWYLNKTGSYVIKLEFQPQKLFFLGSAASITALILCIVYVSKDVIRTKIIPKKQERSFSL